MAVPTTSVLTSLRRLDGHTEFHRLQLPIDEQVSALKVAIEGASGVPIRSEVMSKGRWVSNGAAIGELPSPRVHAFEVPAAE